MSEQWNLAAGQLAPGQICALAAEALKGKQPLDREVTVGDRDYLVSVDPKTEADYANLYWRDITGRKQAESALRAAQKKLLQHAASLEATVDERTAKLRETVHEFTEMGGQRVVRYAQARRSPTNY
jgi:hypothetical protein